MLDHGHCGTCLRPHTRELHGPETKFLGKRCLCLLFSLAFIFSFSNAARCEVIILTYPVLGIKGDIREAAALELGFNYTLPIPRLLQAVCGDLFNIIIPA